MNVAKIIKEATYHIEVMKAKIPYIKNKENLEKHITMINAFIQLLNASENMLYNKFQMDLVDKLLLARLRDYFMQVEAAGDKIPIKTIVNKLDADLNEPINLRLIEVTSLIKSIEIHQLLKKLHFTKNEVGLSKVDTSKCSLKTINEVNDLMKNIPSEEENTDLVIDLIKQLKTKAKWN